MGTSSRSPDRGFTLVELLVAIVILGVLSTVTVFAVRGITDRSTSSACAAELSTLQRATEAYFAQYPGASRNGIATQAYPADTGFAGNPAGDAVAAPTGVTAGATPGGTLVNVGLLRALPTLLFVSPTGQVVNAKAQCGTPGQPANGDTSNVNGGAAPAPTASYALDGLTSQPAAAFSTRRLLNSFTGAPIRVRRSSDNTEADIPFTTTGDLDTAALTGFVGGGDGYVTRWYDQSGNGRDATQTTAANQPRIVSAGVVETMGSRPAVRFLGQTTVTFLQTAAFLDQTMAVTDAFRLAATPSAGTYPALWARNGTYQNGGQFLASIGSYVRFNTGAVGDAAVSGITPNTNHVTSSYSAPTLRTQRLNGNTAVQNASAAGAVPGSQMLRIGTASTTAAATLPGWIGEFIVWTTSIAGATEDAAHAAARAYWGA
jgi:prepilin-type N-terminal cleavage/methylation domain-containing protein